VKVVYVSHFSVSALYRKKIAAIAERGVKIVGLSPPCWIEQGSRQQYEPDDDRNRAVCVPTFFVGSGSLYFFHPGRLGGLLRASKPDIIHIDEEPWSLACLRVLVLRELLCRQAAIVLDSSENLDKRIPCPFSVFEKLMFRAAAAAPAISEQAATRLLKKGFSKRVAVIGHGVSLQDYPQVDKAAAKRSLRLGERLIVGYVGLVTGRKGVFVLLEAFRRAALPDATLLFVGWGDALDDLKARVAADEYLVSRVRFHGGVPHRRVPEILAAVDVLVLPSLSTPRWEEQFGRILIEAMASGVPVIGSQSGAIPSVIGDAGIVVPEEDSLALADALRQLAADKDERARLARAGLERIRAHFTWDCIAERIIALYSEQIPRPKITNAAEADGGRNPGSFREAT